MQTPAIASRFVYLDECGSTNTELVARAKDRSWPDFSVLVTRNQTGGRGRLGRVWVAPPGESLAISVLLRPRLADGAPLALEHYGWLPLIAGLAMTAAIAPLVRAHTVSLKWPNDVLVGEKKVAGLLAELSADGTSVVLGAGLNLGIAAEKLPTATSTSLELNGSTLVGTALADAALNGYLEHLSGLYGRFLEADADPAEAHALLDEHCSTLGQSVKVQLPGADDLFGTATGIDESGRLVVRRFAGSPGADALGTNARDVAVAAGDVTHLRYE